MKMNITAACFVSCGQSTVQKTACYVALQCVFLITVLSIIRKPTDDRPMDPWMFSTRARGGCGLDSTG
jgi:hypothetical protein